MSEKLVTKDAMFKAEDASFMKLGQVLGPCQHASYGERQLYYHEVDFLTVLLILVEGMKLARTTTFA